jgi:uncharacterized protein YaaN involved in tellurite resistance
MKMEIVNTEELNKEITTAIAPEQTEVAEIQKQAQTNVSEIMALDISALEEKQKMLKSIEQFGMDSMQSSAHKNSLLQTTIGNLSKGCEDSSTVSKGLADLHREIKDLDPSPLDFTKEGLLGKIFNPIRRYFERFEKADSVIDGIMISLEKGKSTLTNDNITLDIEEQDLRELSIKLNKELALGTAMDHEISRQIAEAEAKGEDEDKVRFVTEEVLFPLRQRVMDIQQMIVVNHQGIVAMEVIKRNNKELIRGVDRAKTVTITALKTAVMVASALYNQKVVLSKIELLNETTSNLISSTSKMLKEQGTAIQKQATEASVSPETLKEAFSDCIAALDNISTFKQQALPKMQETVLAFQELAKTGEAEIARLTSSQK